jgi:hypothetical protein
MDLFHSGRYIEMPTVKDTKRWPSSANPKNQEPPVILISPVKTRAAGEEAIIDL